MFENHCFRQSKTAGRQPAFSSSELNTAQHGFDRLSACMLSLWNDGTISPCSRRKRKRINVTAVNKYEDDVEVIHGRCKMLFFSPLNLVNFEAVIANLIHELCDTLSRGKARCCLSGCRLGVWDDHIWGQRLHHAWQWNHCRQPLSYEDNQKITLINNSYH